MKTHFLHGRDLLPLCGVPREGNLGSEYVDAVDCTDCARDVRFHEAQAAQRKPDVRMEHVTRGDERRAEEPQKGLRFNKRKLPVHLISPYVTIALAKQLQFGIDKGYPARNWEKGLSWSETIASLERHLLNFKLGENFDSEENPITKEKLPELYGVICNAMFLLHFYETKTGTDDRVKYLERVEAAPAKVFCVCGAENCGQYTKPEAPPRDTIHFMSESTRGKEHYPCGFRRGDGSASSQFENVTCAKCREAAKSL